MITASYFQSHSFSFSLLRKLGHLVMVSLPCSQIPLRAEKKKFGSVFCMKGLSEVLPDFMATLSFLFLPDVIPPTPMSILISVKGVLLCFSVVKSADNNIVDS